MRWAALTLLAMLELSAAHAQTKPDTLSDGQINEIVLCAASFEVRADLMQSWNANSYAISHERHLSSYLVDYVADHSLSRTGFGEGGESMRTGVSIRSKMRSAAAMADCSMLYFSLRS